MNETGLQQWVDMYNKADKERFEALLQRDRYKKALDEIEEICKKSWHDSGITIDYFKRNNYSWKQHQIRSLICRFEQIIQKIKEVKGE